MQNGRIAGVGDLQPGRHTCLIYGDPSETVATVAAYLGRGLRHGEGCIYVPGDPSPEPVLGALAEAGVDVASARRSGALRIATVADLAPEGAADLDGVAAAWRALLEEVKGCGVAGVRVAADMTWMLAAGFSAPRIAEWERRADAGLHEIEGLSAICLYAEPRFPPAMLLGILASHPDIALGEGIYTNPYYVRLEPEGSESRLRSELLWKLSHLGTLESADQLRQTTDRLRAVIEASPLPIVVVDFGGRIRLWSPAAERLFGWTEEEVVGTGYPLAPVERAEEFYRLVQRAAAGESLSGVEIRRRRKDGSLVELSLWTAPLRDGGQKVTGAVAVLEDITALKEAERERERLLGAERRARFEAERRARSEAALRRAAQAVAGMFTIDEVTREITESVLNATGARYAYVERMDMEKNHVEVVAVAGEGAPALGTRSPYHGSYTQLVVEQERAILLPRLDETELGLPEGVAESCGSCAALILHLVDAGGAIGALTLVRAAGEPPFDTEEVGRARTFGILAALGYRKIHFLRDSERRREELQQVMASRERLMRGFSHDVKNPLGVADGYAALMEMEVGGGLTPEQKERVTRIRRAIRSALRLVEDLLELARAEAGELKVLQRPVNLRDVAREMAEEYRGPARSKGLALEFRSEIEIPLIHSDDGRIRQVLGNLLSNAVKYTDAGDVRVEVTTRSGAEAAPGGGSWVCVDVRDTGPGISEEQQERVFMEFTRLDETEEKGGAGLGLAISRRIAGALGGDVRLQSVKGEGSTFTLWLPVR